MDMCFKALFDNGCVQCDVLGRVIRERMPDPGSTVFVIFFPRALVRALAITRALAVHRALYCGHNSPPGSLTCPWSAHVLFHILRWGRLPVVAEVGLVPLL